jgi:hypothetical protein
MSRVIALAASVAVLTGCTNLQAVSTASGQLLGASASWDTVAGEWTASCQRRNQVSLSPSDCVQEKKATDGLEATDKILAAYFTALKDASDTKNFSLDASISTLSGSVAGIPGINAGQVSAVTGFAKFLAGLATSAARERTLDRLIGEGGPQAIATIDVLHSVAVPALGIAYDVEARDTKSAFRTYIKSLNAPFETDKVDCAKGPFVSDLPRGDAYLLALEYCRRSQAVAAKRDALKSYDKSLLTAKATLQGLVDGKARLKDAEVIKALLTDAATLRDDVNALKKAF